ATAGLVLELPVEPQLFAPFFGDFGDDGLDGHLGERLMHLGQVGLDPLQEVRRRGDEGRVGLGIEADVVGVVLRDQPAGLVGGGVVEADEPGLGKRSEEHTSELQSREKLVCRLLLEKKNSGRSRSPGWCWGSRPRSPSWWAWRTA